MPADTSAALQHAVSLHAAGRYTQAIDAYRTVLRRDRRNTRIIGALAGALLSSGRSDEAAEELERGLRIDPKAVSLLQLLAVARKLQGRFEDAHAAIRRALRLAPDDAAVIATEVDVLLAEGRYTDAAAIAIPALARQPANVSLVLGAVRLCPRIESAEWGLNIVDAALSFDGLAVASRARLLFARARLLDMLHRYDEAFDTASKANRLAGARFDAPAHDALIDRMIAAWTPEAIRQSPTSRHDTDRPVFIVGMPRSGTTLVEQILASHPGVHAGGERGEIARLAAEIAGIDPRRIPAVESPARLTVAFLNRAADVWLAPFAHSTAARITDKMPLNFIHLGLIARIFPGARVLHCTRDPRDTCLSCFMHMFEGSLPFAYDLRDLARFYRAYRRLMEHWRHTLDIPINEVPYERIIAEPESGTRSIIAAVGLPWHDACLRFHETRRPALTSSIDQVRQPIYDSSVGRWRHYAQHLSPLTGALGDAIDPTAP